MEETMKCPVYDPENKRTYYINSAGFCEMCKGNIAPGEQYYERENWEECETSIFDCSKIKEMFEDEKKEEKNND